MSTNSLPDFLTVTQAAAVMGIGRTSAYALARRAADFGEGPFPAIRLGKQLRIPRHKLEALSGGPITIPTDDDNTFAPTSHDAPDPTTNTDQPPTTNNVDDTPTNVQQPTLPFTE
ncbi:helix-turn-helix domain-containing protein [Ilumatobacter sp.]|uniref:helix-turn-helix domain-containing protein n=1 Tax=Ilumatobacter sp. TaxID=1967498 RepID=UPI00374FE8AC